MSRRRRDDRGTMVISLAILFPMLMLTISFGWVVNRKEFANAAVDAAAYTSARAASQSRDAATARTRATDTARDTLNANNLHCEDPIDVQVNVDGFAVPVGQPATVTVRITCVVLMDDVVLPGMPGRVTVSATYTSAIDRYRART